MFMMHKHEASISKRFQIFRGFKSSPLKYLVEIIIIYAFAATGVACAEDIRHGTYFVFYVGDDFVAATIDSRETIVSNGGIPFYKDDYCKISTLGDHAVFFAGGVYQRDVIGGFTFDGYKIAREYYNKQTNPLDILRLAREWGTVMAQNITTIYPSFPNEIANSNSDGQISQGYFVSSDNGKIFAAQAIVQMQGQILPIFVPIVTVIAPNSLILSGHKEILAEFTDGQISARAKLVMAEFYNQISGLAEPEIWAMKIEMYAKAVRDWSGDVGIGGEATAIIMERGKKWRWFHQPSFCRNN